MNCALALAILGNENGDTLRLCVAIRALWGRPR
jgi:hypothetical protein